MSFCFLYIFWYLYSETSVVARKTDDWEVYESIVVSGK
jgi:hypothetical protein